MKKLTKTITAFCVILILISLTQQSLAQTLKNEKIPDAKTIGVLIGGSLIGFDYEIRATKKFGIQIGGGYVDYALALNYHPEPKKKGAYLSFNYKDVGFGVLQTMGVEYCYRWYFTENWGLCFQLGIGGVLGYSDEYEEELLKRTNAEKVPSAMLTYGLGITF